MSRRFVLGAVALTVVLMGGAFAVTRVASPSDVEALSSGSGSSGSTEDARTAGSDDVSEVAATVAPITTTTVTTVPAADALPVDSGTGRRVVFSVAGQRMWWVDDTGAVLRTDLVSGRPGTPALGTFAVYSKTEHATGIDGSKMDYFVRFTKGPNGWAIGFHDIPEIDGVPVQTDAQLGEPLSHGCIRQGQDDALFTWDFLQQGDTVVVVA